MIRWNANFVRGLAQSVLDRARVIRTGLTASAVNAAASASKVKTKSKIKTKSAASKGLKKKVTKVRRRRRATN